MGAIGGDLHIERGQAALVLILLPCIDGPTGSSRHALLEFPCGATPSSCDQCLDQAKADLCVPLCRGTETCSKPHLSAAGARPDKRVALDVSITAQLGQKKMMCHVPSRMQKLRSAWPMGSPVRGMHCRRVKTPSFFTQARRSVLADLSCVMDIFERYGGNTGNIEGVDQYNACYGGQACMAMHLYGNRTLHLLQWRPGTFLSC
eukprot:3676568-Amphidinium_carterae.1